MNRKLLLATSLRTMSRHKLRTFFMGVGVTVGVATLLATRSLGGGFEQALLEKVDRMFGLSSIMLNDGGGGPGSFKITDLEAIEEQIAEVVAWDPMLVVGGRELKYQDINRQVTIYGHSERGEEVWNRGVVEGEYFSVDDSASAARVTLIGTRMAEALFGEESPIGEQILLDSIPFFVKGVLEPLGIDPHGEDRDLDVHVPTATVMRRLLNVDYITSAKVLVSDPAIVEETAERIASILRQRHGILEGEPDDFMMFTPKFIRQRVAEASRALKVYLPAAAVVVLLVAAIVIASIMLVAVRERFAEVGLRKALGATDGAIGLQFLAEALAVSLASGLVGVLLGFVAAKIIAAKMGLPTVIDMPTIALALAAAVVVGLLSGLLPARRAARLDPVEALR